MAGILVVGIAVVDAIARPVDALPAPGGLKFFDELAFTTGGCAVNCAIALAKLGVSADLVARVGRDPLGDFLIAELTRAHVATGHVVRDECRPTSFSFVAVPRGGERAFLHTTGANATLLASDVKPDLLMEKQLAIVTGAMLMDSLDGEPTAGLLREARAAGARTILDTVYVEGVAQEEWRRRVAPTLGHLDYFVPSEAEAKAITALNDPATAARAFRQEGARNVVIKLGARGVLCVDENGRETFVPAFRVAQTVDATGAGDCWLAGFVAGLQEGQPFIQAARFGNAVAAVSVQAPGATTGILGLDQVKSFISN